ncbi:MAG: tripartite tricarboxylate transporter substrate binding protein [Clostridium sp.]|uniref:tripartite tricarboxylate transporter substrate binding protein n=1 Tax=Enterocloster citroniae TaxID=358743 RepID=UPI00349E61DD|nr:tripartite tricarboxylate transporter substrate binding protein [Clostridium sp.]
MKKISKFFMLFLVFTLIAACGAGCKKQDIYPSKPITFMIGFDPGTGADVSGRLLASLAEKDLGVSVNILNKPGTSGAVSYKEIMGYEPDGYTIVQGTLTLLTHNLMGTIDHSFRDMTPIMTYQTEASAILMSASAPFSSFREMVSYAKEHPGEVTIATSSSGGVTNIIANAVANALGIEFNIIAGTGGGADCCTQCAGGHTNLAIGSFAESQAHIDAGNLIALGVTGSKRASVWPDVPTFAELGIEAANVEQIRGVFGPPDMKEEDVKILQDALMKAANSPEFLENVEKTGATSTVLDAKQTGETFETFEKIIAPILEN